MMFSIDKEALNIHNMSFTNNRRNSSSLTQITE